MNAKLKFNYEAPRWAKAESFIKKLALWHGVKCDVAVSKGLLTESGTVVCEGEENTLKIFKDELELAMRQYNSR